MDYLIIYEDGTDVLVHGGPGSGRKFGSKNKKGTKADRGEVVTTVARGSSSRANVAAKASALLGGSSKRKATVAKVSSTLKKKKKKAVKAGTGKRKLNNGVAKFSKGMQKKVDTANARYNEMKKKHEQQKWTGRKLT